MAIGMNRYTNLFGVMVVAGLQPSPEQVNTQVRYCNTSPGWFT